jgi:hypothetical protein
LFRIRKKKLVSAMRLRTSPTRPTKRPPSDIFEVVFALIKECFSDPDNVFLVVASEDTEAPLGRFFFWDSDEIFPDTSFPLDERLLEASTLPAARREPAVSQSEPVVARPKKQRFPFALSIAAVVLGIVAATTTFVYAAQKRRESPEQFRIREHATSPKHWGNTVPFRLTSRFRN